jgi:alpha-L-fucosidase 2
MKKMPALPPWSFLLALWMLTVLLPAQCPGQPANSTGQTNTDIRPWLDACNVQWNEPGPGSAQSMPLGNGDIGVNCWVETNGDLSFYISKTDAWGGVVQPGWDPWMRQGGVLMKLGLVHISLFPDPLNSSTGHAAATPAGATPFHQILKLHDGEIIVQEGERSSGVQLRIWVDANQPVIRVETKSQRPVSVRVTLDDWRIGQGDTILRSRNDRITWYHHNPSAGDTALSDPHLAGITFGAIIKGTGLVRKDNRTLGSVAASNTGMISIYPLTATTATPEEWLSGLNRQVARIDRTSLEQARLAHRRWWDRFWHRSWVYIHGDSTAANTTRGYVLQRFVTACAGRGAYPIKFNGSIFTVDNPTWKTGQKAAPTPMDADFRAWGGQYWFQNTRPMYWPRLMAGDFDLMRPFFRMYADMLPGNAALVKKYYHHGGAYFMETTPFWGGLPFMGPEAEALYTHHYFSPILELSLMMLDYYDYTQDESFARETLLPVASEGLRFFDEHFGRDAQGKLLLDPVNAIEMFWKVHDPAPDIAGLRAVLTRMIALADNPLLGTASASAGWKRLLGEIPSLPMDTVNGKMSLLPYTGPQTARPHNIENPELYAIYPYRIYGLGKPDLQLAINTFNARKFREKGCWNQDPIQAAMLGLANTAREYTSFNLTRKDPELKFPAFWASAHDYKPDEDNGGNGENGLQQMILQTDGKKILLLPAWPKDWDADFRLHAPYNTTVEGRIVRGRLTRLVVTPSSRLKDVVDWSRRPDAGNWSGQQATGNR